MAEQTIVELLQDVQLLSVVENETLTNTIILLYYTFPYE